MVLAEFTAGTAERPRGAGLPVFVPLVPGAPLREEWAVVCDSPAFAAVLSAWERPGQEAVLDGEREFEVVWTLDPVPVRAAGHVCLDVAEASGAVDDVAVPPHGPGRLAAGRTAVAAGRHGVLRPGDRAVRRAGPTMTDAPVRRDRVRQAAVTAAEVFCVLGTLVGVGVLGTRVAESSGGALAADATLIAPAGPAFSIWSVIYAGLAAYTVWQWLPGAATSARTRTTGWLAAATMVLNATWLLVTQQGWIWVSVGVIVALLLALGVLLQRLTRHPASGVVERVVVDGTFGLYLGWVTVATCANITAALVDSGVDPGPTASVLAAVAVLAVAAGVGILLARRLGGRWSVAVALAWGLAWIVVGRLADQPESTVTAVAAGVAALVVLVATARQRSPRPAMG